MANSLRKHDDRRKRKRHEVKERKEADEARKREELKRLKALKRNEIMEKIEKLKQITGNDEVGFKVSLLQTKFTLQWTSPFTFISTGFDQMIYAPLFFIVKIKTKKISLYMSYTPFVCMKGRCTFCPVLKGYGSYIVK
jgi:hypothetical protein